MLIGDVSNKGATFSRDPNLQSLIDTLALTHVSRYPIQVEAFSYDAVIFKDARFRGDRLLRLSIDSANKKMTIDCQRIANNKYNSNSAEYTTRTTNDLAKMRKWLKEYVQPYDHSEAVQLNYSPMYKVFSAWVEELYDTWREAYSAVNSTEVIADMLNYLGGGQPYSTGRLAAFATQEFCVKVTEYNRRKTCPQPNINLFVNPDGAIWVANTQMARFSGCSISSAQVLDSANALADNLKEKYSMLKMVDDNTLVDGVGVRVSHNNFWVHE